MPISGEFGYDVRKDSLVDQNAYWKESRRPLVSLVFVTPILIGYELGLLWLGKDGLRNGAEAWLRWLLNTAGFTQYFLLPVLTCGLLLGWHHLRREPWRITWSVYYGMFVESVLFALILLGIARVQGRWFTMHTLAFDWLRKPVGFLGAGLYEELLFRLLLLTGLTFVLRATIHRERGGLTAAILATSLLFSAAHYNVDWTWLGIHYHGGDSFHVSSFVFRFLAGVYFAVLFWFRGFGIVAATHTLYDLFTLV